MRVSSDRMAEVCTDLGHEHDALDGLVSTLPDEGWDRPSAAEGWSVRDSISHLAQFEEEGLIAISDPDAFAALSSKAARMETVDPTAYVATGVDRGRASSPTEVLQWWRSSRALLIDGLRTLHPKARIPWFANSMSALSFATARLMETWAHGLDVADGLGVTLQETDRLRHIALLGCFTREHAYRVNGLPSPLESVRVELTLPSGTPWSWGPEDATNRISGSVGGFCRVVTRRRHIDDVDLVVKGPMSREWMVIAQAYAGPPGSGRPPRWSLSVS